MPAAVFTRTRFETDESFTTAQELGLDFTREPFGLEEFRMSMDLELVHGTRDQQECDRLLEFSLDEAEITAATIGIDFSQEDFEGENLQRAMNVELEHGCCHPETNITHCDPILTAKLALAHLRERGDFYRHLDDVEGHLPR